MPSTSQSIRVRVPAKINLMLTVGPLRPDGFHELSTVFHAVDLTDTVTVTAAPSMSLTCTNPAVPTDATNLAWRAADLVADTAGVRPGVTIHIDKTIPVAGGMAGGSADAAATLLACDLLWRTGLGAQRLSTLAAQLGSDVAFALLGGTAIGTGRGELLEPVPCPGLHWVLVPATFGISAGEAYRELDRQRATTGAAPTTTPAALDTSDLHALADALSNDLQPAAVALRPELGLTLTAVEEAGALRAIVSGSGPTVAGLCRDAAHAAEVAAHLEAAGHRALTAAGPVPGATVVD